MKKRLILFILKATLLPHTVQIFRLNTNSFIQTKFFGQKTWHLHLLRHMWDKNTSDNFTVGKSILYIVPHTIFRIKKILDLLHKFLWKPNACHTSYNYRVGVSHRQFWPLHKYRQEEIVLFQDIFYFSLSVLLQGMKLHTICAIIVCIRTFFGRWSCCWRGAGADT